MRRLATAWILAAIVLLLLGTGRNGALIEAQETTTPAAGSTNQPTESENLLTRIADAQRNEDALLAALAAAQATERAELQATATALEDQLVAAEATSAARATEVAMLQTQVADLEAAQGGAAAPTDVVEVGMNEVAHVGPWDITVTGVERGDSIEGLGDGSESVDAQGEFLLVALEIVNTGTEAQTYDPSWFQVTDDRGRSWPQDFTQTDNLALAGAGTRQYAQLQPGLPATAVVVFDIAPDATGLTLQTMEDLGATSEPQPAPFVINLEP